MTVVKKTHSPLPWSKRSKPSGNFAREKDNQPFYNSTAWRKCATSFRSLEQNMRCASCHALGIPMPTEQVDHIIRLEEGGAPFSPANLQGLCRSCHSSKSAMERHHGILVAWKLNADLEKIPLNKIEIIERMHKRPEL